MVDSLTFQNWVDWVSVLPGRGKLGRTFWIVDMGIFKDILCGRNLWRIWNIGLQCYLEGESWYWHLKVLIWGFFNGHKVFFIEKYIFLVTFFSSVQFNHEQIGGQWQIMSIHGESEQRRRNVIVVIIADIR